MRERIIFLLLLGFDALILLYSVSTLSITAHEADVYLYGSSFVHYLSHASTYLFGQNDFALRLPMIVFHLLSVLLLYRVSKPYVKRNSDRLWLVFVYMLLPGVMSAALLVNSAGVMIFSLFLLLYLHQKNLPFIPFLLVFYLFIDGAYSLLYFALFFYAWHKNSRFYMVLTVVLFWVSYLIYGFDTMGKPSGHFLDTLGLYATIFSPVVFVFIVYVLYRSIVSKKEDIALYIGGGVFIASLLLSFRQQIHIESFAPYLMLLLPLAAQTFFSSYRVRLREFRGRYRMLLAVGFALLSVHFFLLLFNQGVYLFLENPKDHFAYKAHIAKELAMKLHEKEIDCIFISNRNLQNRLEFYGVKRCKNQILEEVLVNEKADVTVRYMGKVAAAYNVTKSPI